MKIKATLIALTAILSAPLAIADQAQANFTTTVASYCTVGQVTSGVMHVSGTTVSTDVPAEMSVNSNEGGVYKVGVTNPGDFTVKPAGYTGTATINGSYSVAGANTITATAGGIESNLDNSGANTLSVSVDGTLDTEAIAGNYEAVSIVSCVAQ